MGTPYDALREKNVGLLRKSDRPRLNHRKKTIKQTCSNLGGTGKKKQESLGVRKENQNKSY